MIEKIPETIITCEKCNKLAKYSNSRWINDDHLIAEYWCEDHKPVE